MSRAIRTPPPLSGLPSRGEYVHEELTRGIIAAAFEVHNHLGRGFLEKVYENALAVELKARGFDVRTQADLTVTYKGVPVGSYLADILVNKAVVCEVKAIAGLDAAHEAQVLNYLKATGMRVGLLLNFGTSRVQVKRFVF